MAGRRRPGSPGVSSLQGGSFARVLRAKALPDVAAAPVTGRMRSPPYPAAALSLTTRLSTSRRVRQSPGECHSQRDRNAAHCPVWPLQRQGHPKIVSNRFAETIFRTHP
jgi:hypothetical protein